MLNLSLLLVLLTGCGRPQDSSSFTSASVPPTATALLASQTVTSALEGTDWALLLLNGNNPAESTDITLNLATGTVSGLAGCNAYRPLIIEPDTDKYRSTENGILKTPGFVITEKNCSTPEGVMQQETAYADALRNAAAFRMSEERLEIMNAAGETTLIFAREH